MNADSLPGSSSRGINGPTGNTVDITQSIHSVAIRPIKRGYMSEIYTGVWQSKQGPRKVTVKVMRRSNGRDFVTVFLRELPARMQLDHFHIAPIYGIYRPEADAVALVSPWYDCGNIMEYLSTRKDLEHGDHGLKLALLSDALQGLKYLHECGIFHGNLKGSNVLVSVDGRALLSDGYFNIEPGDNCFVDATRSIRWYPPELLSLPGHPRPTASGDVWLFGGLSFEVLCGMPVHRTFKTTALAYVALSQGRLPKQPATLQHHNAAWEFCLACWNFAPEQRPTVANLDHDLCALLAGCRATLPDGPHSNSGITPGSQPRPVGNFINTAVAGRICISAILGRSRRDVLLGVYWMNAASEIMRIVRRVGPDPRLCNGRQCIYYQPSDNSDQGVYSNNDGHWFSRVTVGQA